MHDSVKVQGGSGGISGNGCFFYVFFLKQSYGEALSSAPASVFQSMTVTVDRFCSLLGLLSQTADL